MDIFISLGYPGFRKQRSICMNKIYKLVWSKVRNAWVVTSEIARGHGKESSSGRNGKRLKLAVMTAILGGCFMTAGMINAGAETTMVGDGNQAVGNWATAVGRANDVDGEAAAGVGLKNTVKGKFAIGLGSYNTMTGEYALGLGILNVVTGQGAIGLGQSNTVEGPAAMATGIGNTVKGIVSMAAGNANEIDGDSAVAFGGSNKVKGEASIGVGLVNQTDGKAAVAFGGGNIVKGEHATGLGQDNQVIANYSVGLGHKNYIEAQNSTVVGNNNTLKRHVTDKNGSLSLNNIVAGQNLEVEGAYNAVFGTDYQNNSENRKTMAAGKYNTVIGVGNLAGYTAEKDPQDRFKWIYKKVEDGSDSGNVVVGMNNTATRGSLVIGADSEASSLGTSVGHHNKIIGGGDYGLALGNDLTVKGQKAVAIGSKSKATANYATAIGRGAIASQESSIAFGRSAKAQKEGSVAIGSFSRAERDKEVYGYNPLTKTAYDDASIGAMYDPSKVKELEKYTETIAQKTQERDEADRRYNELFDQYEDMLDGKGNIPDTKENREKLGKELDKAQDALRDAEEALDSAQKQRTKITAPYQSSEAAVAVGNEKTGITRQITGVAAGSEDTDAVNVAQLKALNNKVDQGADNIIELQKGWTLGVARGDDSETDADATAVGENAKVSAGDKVTLKAGRGIKLKQDGTNVQIGLKFIDMNPAGYPFNDAKATGAGSLAVGQNSVAKAHQATAVGLDTEADQYGVALGTTSKAGSGAVAIGSRAFANGDDSIAIGGGKRNVEKDPTKGYRKIDSKYAIAIGASAAIGEKSEASSAVGYYAEIAQSEWSSAFGGYSKIENSKYASTLGAASKVENAAFGTALGGYSEVQGSEYGTSLGTSSRVQRSDYGTALGSNAAVIGAEGGVAIGAYSVADRSKASMMGYNPAGDQWNNVKDYLEKTGQTDAFKQASAKVQAAYQAWEKDKKNPELLANYYQARAEQSKMISTWTGLQGAVSIGDEREGLTRQLTGLAAGTKDTDAVNVAQLKALNTKVEGNKIHYLSIGPDNEKNLAKDGNYNNDGADSHWGIAIGVNASSKGGGSIAIGKGSQAHGTDEHTAQGVSIGSASRAIGAFATAVGHDTKAFGERSVAYGLGEAYGKGSIAIGSGAVAALKKGITKEEYNKLSDEEKAWYGKADYDDQKTFYQFRQKGKDGKAEDIKNYGMAIGSGATSFDNAGLAVGLNAKTNKDFGVAIGGYAENKVEQGVALGTSSVADREKGSMGYLPTTGKAIENFEEAMKATGKETAFKELKAKYLAAQEKLTKAQEAYKADQSPTNMMNLDKAQKEFKGLTDEYAVMTAPWTSRRGAVSVGNDKTGFTRQITGVAAGSEDTDAVNVAQLKVVNTKVDQNKTDITNLKNISGKVINGTNTTVTEGMDKDGKTKTYAVNVAADGQIAENNTGIVTGDTVYKFVNPIKTQVTNMETTVNNLKAGFTLKGEAGGSVDVALGETKPAITFKAETKNDDGATSALTATVDDKKNVTYTLNTKKLKEEMGLAQGVGSMSSWKLKATDATAETIADGEEVEFAVEEAGKGLTVKQVGKKIQYGIDSDKLIDNINNNTTKKITNVDGSQIDISNNTSIKNIDNKITNLSGKATKVTVNNKEDNRDDANANLKIRANTVNGQTTYDLSLNDNITIGKDGKDGKIGINGKDGKSADITVGKGEAGVDGKDGITRIIYKDQDKNPHEVATLDDGLKFKGDNDAVVIRKLNTQLNITGGADATDLSDDNIGVVGTAGDNGGLAVKLSKNLKGLTSAQFKDGDNITNITAGDITVTKKEGNETKTVNIWKLNETVNNITAGTTDVSSWKLQANGANDRTIKKDSIVNFTNGTATKVTVKDNDVTVDLNDATKKQINDNTTNINNMKNDITDIKNTVNNIDTKIEQKIEGAKITVKGDDTTGVKVEEKKGDDGKVKGYEVSLKEKVKVGNITIDGTTDGTNKKGEITGLTNTTVDATDFATKGRAATEEQLKAAMGKVQAQSRTTVKGSENITVTPKTESASEYTVELAKKINVDSVTANEYKVGDKTYINKDGLNANSNKIINVADGKISKDSKDAVNGSQLFATNQQVVSNMNQINSLRDESREGDALGAAMAALKPIDFDPYQRSQIMAGVGYYRGKEAVALGLAHYKNEDLMFHGGLAYAGNSELMANIGVTYRFGSKDDRDIKHDRNLRMPQYAEGPISSVYILQDEVERLTKENKEANDRIAALEAKLEKVLEKVK